MKFAKIPRLQTMPSIAAREIGKNHRYPGSVRISKNVQLIFRTTRYRNLVYQNDSVRKSELIAYLVADNQRIGALGLERYKIDRCMDKDDFWLAMDEASEDELASTLCLSWKDVVEEVAWIGPILYFRYAWVDKRYSGQDLLQLATRAITRTIWPRYSLLVMKAFPLEYASSDIPLDSPLRFALSNRRRAMVRYYARIFGTRPFPGSPGKNGWLWALHSEAEGVAAVPYEQPKTGQSL